MHCINCFTILQYAVSIISKLKMTFLMLQNLKISRISNSNAKVSSSAPDDGGHDVIEVPMQFSAKSNLNLKLH